MLETLFGDAGLSKLRAQAPEHPSASVCGSHKLRVERSRRG